MPPVRWKTLSTVTVFLICITHITATSRESKELTEDGWKPIIGHGLGESHFSKENIHYRPEDVQRNPNFHQENIHHHQPQKNFVKKHDEQQIHAPKTTEKNQISLKQITSNTPRTVSQQTGQYYKNKPHNVKHHQIHYITSQGFTQPKAVLTHRSQNKIPKYPVMGKTHVAPSANAKRIAKPPPRGPVGAYSQREEILAPAPSTGLGNFAYYTHNNPSRLQHTNLDYINNFAQQNDLFQFQRLPVQQYVVAKQPQNEIPYTFQAQNDEYTRNLVPPPPSKEFIENAKQKTKQTPKIESTTELPKVTKAQNDVIVQVQTPYQQNPIYFIQNQNEQAIDVQVTKENVKELQHNVQQNIQHNTQHNIQENLQHNIPIHFPNQENYYQFKKPSQAPNRPTYEVTESKDWQDTPTYEQFQFQHAVKGEKRRRPDKQEIFLPTPVKPLSAIPTLPTQDEASTIFTALSQKINKQKQQLDPSFFNIKEVSTHYPILGRPVLNHFEFSLSDDRENEITTLRPKVLVDLRPKNKFVVEEFATEAVMTTTPLPVTKNWELKRRPNPSRRRRPYRTKPTTEEVVEEEVETTTVYRPQRRRPTHQRTTEATMIENKRSRYRTRPRPTQETVVEEMIENPKPTLQYAQKTRGSSYKQTAEGIRHNNEEQYQKTRFDEVEATEEEPASEEMMEAIENIEYNTRNYEEGEEDSTTTDVALKEDVSLGGVSSGGVSSGDAFSGGVTSGGVSSGVVSSGDASSQDVSLEQEDYSTKPSHGITIKEVWESQTETDDTTLATTTTTTSTTTPEPTTTRKLLRQRRPIQYQARPKFSVKEYKQRINEYIASTTESTRITEETTRSRVGYRTRRPLINKHSLNKASISNAEENNKEPKEETTEITQRKKFIPKDPRHGGTLDHKDDGNIEVKPSRKPGRYRSTTQPTTKVSIKPNILSNLRRPPHASLRDRILNKNKTFQAEKTTEETPNQDAESIENEETETTEIVFKHVFSTTTAAPSIKPTFSTVKPMISSTIQTTTIGEEIDDEEEMRDVDILKNDAVLQSQRVSDLTSSAQNDYNTPGMFKSVNSNVRRVPSYFTIATEDPILPIEAFFTNINKDRN